MPKPTDSLIKRMEQLYEQFYGRLYAYVMPLLNNEDEAADVVGEVMETVWRQYKEGTLTTNVTASYLYTMARNRCISRLRHNKVHTHYAEIVRHTTDIRDDGEVAEYEQRLETIRRKVDELPEPDHSIFMNCYFRKMTYQQTADLLGISFVTVKKHIMHVLAQWRKELKKEK